MKKILIVSVILGMIAAFTAVSAQPKTSVKAQPKVEVYYFHPGDRCPIDQSIEENTIKVMYTNFAKEIKDGTILFGVINTDDKTTAKLASKFDINAQALYIVKIEKGKEIQKDLTRFAFDYGQSNPGKFKAGLIDEIKKELK
jgi:hypothetical protein